MSKQFIKDPDPGCGLSWEFKLRPSSSRCDSIFVCFSTSVILMNIMSLSFPERLDRVFVKGRDNGTMHFKPITVYASSWLFHLACERVRANLPCGPC